MANDEALGIGGMKAFHARGGRSGFRGFRSVDRKGMSFPIYGEFATIEGSGKVELEERVSGRAVCLSIDRDRQRETFEKCTIFFKIKKGENFNHRNTLSILRIKI